MYWKTSFTELRICLLSKSIVIDLGLFWDTFLPYFAYVAPTYDLLLYSSDANSCLKLYGQLLIDLQISQDVTCLWGNKKGQVCNCLADFSLDQIIWHLDIRLVRLFRVPTWALLHLIRPQFASCSVTCQNAGLGSGAYFLTTMFPNSEIRFDFNEGSNGVF